MVDNGHVDSVQLGGVRAARGQVTPAGNNTISAVGDSGLDKARDGLDAGTESDVLTQLEDSDVVVVLLGVVGVDADLGDVVHLAAADGAVAAQADAEGVGFKARVAVGGGHDVALVDDGAAAPLLAVDLGQGLVGVGLDVDFFAADNVDAAAEGAGGGEGQKREEGELVLHDGQ